MNRNFVLDASLAASWRFEDEATAATQEILLGFGKGALGYVPALWAWEVGNILCMAERKKRHGPEDRQRKLEMLGKLPIVLDDFAHSQAWTDAVLLAQKHRLTVYDAAYLEMAIRLSLPLGSLDGDLRAAAVKESVKCIPETLQGESGLAK